MKQGKILELYGTLAHLGSQETPLKFSIVKNLRILEKNQESFQEQKELKFKELAKVDGNGDYVLTEGAKVEIDKKNINSSMLPFGAYEYKEDDGLKKMTLFIEELKGVDVKVDLFEVSLQKKILIGEGKEVTLEDYLESSGNKIDARSLNTLLDCGLIF